METKRLSTFLASQVSPFLRDHGFRRRGQQYWSARGPNSLIIHFQQHGESFTCDIRVVSALLLAEYGPYPAEHWIIRLGPMIEGYDKWWSLEEDASVVAADLLPTLALGIEHVEVLVTDEGLRDSFLRGATTGALGLAPVEAEWLATLTRHLGVPDWAAGLPIRIRDESSIRLPAPSIEPS